MIRTTRTGSSSARAAFSEARLPKRVVAIGGGTGLPAVLRGLRRSVLEGADCGVTAVVAVSDDGGSSGRVRRSLGVPAPGDVRNCLVALAEEETLLAALFQHRYGGSRELGGHSVGNLILAALAEQTGCFLKAVEMSSRVLTTVGRILPATHQNVQLTAVFENGHKVVGETQIAAVEHRIRRVSLEPSGVVPAPGVVEAILEAELVVIGPGSLYKSILPNLAITAIAEALNQTQAGIVVVANLVSEPGASPPVSRPEQVRIIEQHAGGGVVDGVLVNEAPIDPSVQQRYEIEGSVPLTWPDVNDRTFHIERRSVLADGPKLRHDPVATMAGLAAIWEHLETQRGGAR